MNIETISNALKRRHNLPDDFHFWRWECLPHEHGKPTEFVTCTGGQCPMYTKGPKKGTPNYRRNKTRIVFTVSVAEVEQFERDYEETTGNCHDCQGRGQEYSGWHHEKGTSYRVCLKCGGSGKCA